MVVELVKERENFITDSTGGGITTEAMAYCPECKAVQTININKGQLVQTRKYSQYENRIYHDCGSLKPCRLYKTF